MSRALLYYKVLQILLTLGLTLEVFLVHVYLFLRSDWGASLLSFIEVARAYHQFVMILMSRLGVP